MEFRSQQDIDAPCAQVFAALTDFPALERRIMHRGARIRRLDAPPAAGAGAEWEARFRLRGRERQLHLVLNRCEAPSHLGLEGGSPAFAVAGTIELIALGPRSTRMSVVFTTRPRTMPARLALQSLRLARGRLQARFDAAVARLALDMAAR